MQIQVALPLCLRVNCCPKKVYKYDPKTAQVEVERADECIYCMECTMKAEDVWHCLPPPSQLESLRSVRSKIHQSTKARDWPEK
jgi:hypothetical protein